MTPKRKPTRKPISAYLYRITNSGPNRRHIEIPARDRQDFKSVGLVAVIPLDDCIRERLENVLDAEFQVSLTNGVR